MGNGYFNENQEFTDRLFVAEQNLQNIGISNSIGVHYEGQDPIIRLNSFSRWASRIGWILPSELLENRASQLLES